MPTKIQLLRQGSFDNEFIETIEVVPNQVLGFDAQGNAAMTVASVAAATATEVLGTAADQQLPGTFTDVTGLTLSLATAGTYIVFALLEVRAVNPGTPDYELFSAKLRNTTAGVDITGGTHFVHAFSLKTSQLCFINKIIVVTPFTIVLQAKSTFGGFAVPTGSSILALKL